jgi:hypothetical protein
MTAKLWSFSIALGSDAADLREMSVEAIDGSIGKVKDVVDQLGGAYLVVDTGPWIFGKTVRLPAGVVTAVDTDQRCVFIDRSKEDVKNAPEHDPDAPDETAHREALTAYYGTGRQTPGFGGSSDAEQAQFDESPTSPTGSGSARLGGPTSQSLGSERDVTPMPAAGDLDAAPQPTGGIPSGQRSEKSPEAEQLDTDTPSESGVISSGQVGAAPTDVSPREQDTPEHSAEAAAVESPPRDGANTQLSAEQTSPTSEEKQPALTHEPSTDLAEEESGGAEEAPAQRRFARDAGPSSSKPTSKSPSARSGGNGKSRASSDDMPIARYESLTAAEVIARLRNLSQRELATVARYEKRHADRRTILDRIGSLQEDEPWRGYDGATVDEIKKKLANADQDRAKAVRDYERRHRDRKGVMEAARRTVAAA